MPGAQGRFKNRISQSVCVDHMLSIFERERRREREGETVLVFFEHVHFEFR